MGGYGSLLGALSGAMNPAAKMGVGMGAPPAMPGLPPPPTGVGAMPVNIGGTDKKQAADEAILKLREAIGHFPNLKVQLEATIDALKASAAGPSAPKQELGAPSAPGTPPPDVPAPSVGGGSPGDL